MKILKNNFNGHNNEGYKKQNDSYPRNLVCVKCRSELEYNESDLEMGFLGCMYLKCPCCNYENMLEENENSIILTKDNVEFPVHFYHTSYNNQNIKHCCNNSEVKSCIKNAIDFFRDNKDEFAWATEYGDLYVVVYRLDGDQTYEVVVSNDFYTTSIPFDVKDY